MTLSAATRAPGRRRMRARRRTPLCRCGSIPAKPISSTHMGTFRSRPIAKSLRRLFGIHSLSQNCTTRPVPAPVQTHIRSPQRLHQYPAYVAVMAQENETILELGIEGQIELRFVHLDPPGLNRSWEITKFVLAALSGGLHHGTLDNNAEGDIFPERDQQLPRQRDDDRLFKTAAIASDALLKPQGQRRLRLVA
jgi:hypothetical protein